MLTVKGSNRRRQGFHWRIARNRLHNVTWCPGLAFSTFCGKYPKMRYGKVDLGDIFGHAY